MIKTHFSTLGRLREAEQGHDFGLNYINFDFSEVICCLCSANYRSELQMKVKIYRCWSPTKPRQIVFATSASSSEIPSAVTQAKTPQAFCNFLSSLSAIF